MYSFKYKKGVKYSDAKMSLFDGKDSSGNTVKGYVSVSGWWVNPKGELVTIKAFQNYKSKNSATSKNNKSNDEWVSLIFEVTNTETFVQCKVPAVYNISNGTAHLGDINLHLSTKKGWVGRLSKEYKQQFARNSQKGKNSN